MTGGWPTDGEPEPEAVPMPLTLGEDWRLSPHGADCWPLMSGDGTWSCLSGRHGPTFCYALTNSGTRREDVGRYVDRPRPTFAPFEDVVVVVAPRRRSWWRRLLARWR